MASSVDQPVTQSGPTAVGELAPLIRESLDEMDRERRLPPSVARALAEAGVFRLGIPRQLGGHEAEPLTMVRTIEELSAIDGSVGWCAMISSLYGVFGGCLPTDAAREIYGSDPNVITAGTFRPTADAVAVDGGYRVSGRWPFASHCQNASWLCGGARLMDGGQPRLRADGTLDFRLFFFPTSDCLIVDTWQSMGLRGTGSHDLVVADLFVPAARSISFREPAVATGPLYVLPLIAFFATGIAAVPLGIARHAIDILQTLATTKKTTWGQSSLREHPTVQTQLGEAHALVRAGRALVYDALDEAWRTVCNGGHLSTEQRAWLWLAATQATSFACQAVDLMFTAGSATSVYASAGLERCLRDVRTAAQHTTVITNNLRFAGQAFFGLDVSATQFGIDDRGDR